MPSRGSRLLRLLLLPLALSGCVRTGEDSNTQVFRTRQQVARDRAILQRAAAVKTAVSVVAFDRPDIAAHASGDFAVALAADGITRIVDLTPIGEELVKADDQRPIVRHFLAKQLPIFDRDRVIALGGQIAARVEPRLASGKQVDRLSEQAKAAGGGSGPLPAVHIVTDLNWVPVVSVGGGAAQVPLDAELLRKCHLAETDVMRAALDNLDKTPAGEPVYTVTDFPNLGPCGHLKPGVNPAVVLLPHFANDMRAAWKTDDNLVVFLPSAGGVMFVERKKEKLLDKLIPQWRQILAGAADPLCENFLVIGGEKPELLTYAPTTQVFVAPASKPASKPIYIVR
jgi:hypothetical protein